MLFNLILFTQERNSQPLYVMTQLATVESVANLNNLPIGSYYQLRHNKYYIVNFFHIKYIILYYIILFS